MTLDTVRQPAINTFDMCNVRADMADEEQREQKPVVGWGDKRVLLGNDPTGNAASRFEATGIIYGTGAVCEGHFDKWRREDVERMIVWHYDDAKQPHKIDEWLEGRACRDCGERKTLNSHNFYADSNCHNGFKTICIECVKYKERTKYANGRNGNVREYRRN